MSSTVEDLEDIHVLGKQGTVEIILQNILVGSVFDFPVPFAW